MSGPATIAAVAIGRNEGERLIRCLTSLAGQVERLIYVDSGSTDGSVAAARDLGAEVVELDTTTRFTAARARNAGFDRLRSGQLPEFVQFVDGDCEIQPGWLDAAATFLSEHKDVAVVCGRRRERFPDATRYNRMIDEEWDTPIGEARACGGDALMRTQAFTAVGGFNPEFIAGEEPELCVRLRAAGWRIWRLDAEMTLHDAALTRFGQWWTRARRAGHAYAEGAALHGAPPERHNVAQTRRAVLWGLAIPSAAVLGTALSPWSLALLLAWPAQVARLTMRGDAPESAMFNTIGKLPEALGVLDFHIRRLTHRPSQVIEYK